MLSEISIIFYLHDAEKWKLMQYEMTDKCKNFITIENLNKL